MEDYGRSWKIMEDYGRSWKIMEDQGRGAFSQMIQALGSDQIK